MRELQILDFLPILGANKCPSYLYRPHQKLISQRSVNGNVACNKNQMNSTPKSRTYSKKCRKYTKLWHVYGTVENEAATTYRHAAYILVAYHKQSILTQKYIVGWCCCCCRRSPFHRRHRRSFLRLDFVCYRLVRMYYAFYIAIDICVSLCSCVSVSQ